MIRPQRPRPASARRPARVLWRTLLPAVAVGVVVPLAGCGATGGPVSAGPAPTAHAPRLLWSGAPDGPSRAPAPVATGSGDIRAVDPLATVRADLAAHPAVTTGPDGLDDVTRRKVAGCSAAGPGCPVRRPEYHDLTGDGRDDLVIGIDMPDGALSLRAYTLRGGKAERIMSYPAEAKAVQVAGRDLIVWEDTTAADYRQRTVYSWDARQRAMEFQSQEYRRVSRATGSPSGAAR